MPGPFTSPVAQAVPFEPLRDPDFNGDVGTLTAANVQDAIEEVYKTAQGSAVRYAITCGYGGQGKGKWLEFFRGLPSDLSPFIEANAGLITNVTCSMDMTTPVGTLNLYKNGTLIDTFTMTGSGGVFVSGTLAHALAPGDKLSVFGDNNMGTNLKDPLFVIFIKVTL